MLKIHYTTILEDVTRCSLCSFTAQDTFLGSVLVISNQLESDATVKGLISLNKKAIPTLYNLKILEDCDDDLLYKAEVEGLEATTVSAYGVIYRDANVIIQSPDSKIKPFSVYKYKSGWLLK